MSNYTSQLEDTIFCNDRSISSYGGWDKDTSNSNYLYFGTHGRLNSKKPSLICPIETDKFTVNGGNGNGTLTYPVGLISADEIVYAGMVFGGRNTSYYLYTGEKSMWSFSPYEFNNYNAYEFSCDDNFSGSIVFLANGLRPVISLKPGTVVTGGDGSSTSPFTV